MPGRRRNDRRLSNTSQTPGRSWRSPQRPRRAPALRRPGKTPGGAGRADDGGDGRAATSAHDATTWVFPPALQRPTSRTHVRELGPQGASKLREGPAAHRFTESISAPRPRDSEDPEGGLPTAFTGDSTVLGRLQSTPVPIT